MKAEIRRLREQAKESVIDGTKGLVFESVSKGKVVTTTKYSAGKETVVTEDSSNHVAVPVLEKIIAIEEALTRVQRNKQRAIEFYHKMLIDDERLGMDKEKLKLHKQRLMGQIDLDGLVDSDDVDVEA